MDNKFKCPKCPDRAFTSERGLIMHNVRMHSGKNWGGAKKSKQALISRAKIPVEDLGTTCPICSNKYSNRQSLGHHVRGIHHKSLYEFPPYKRERSTRVPFTTTARFDRGMPVRTGVPTRELITLVMDIYDVMKTREGK